MLGGGRVEAAALGVSSVLNLNNFDDADVPEHTPFVLNSPRSLRACHRFGVRPVELLLRSMAEFEEIYDGHDHAAIRREWLRFEKSRQRLLAELREERDRYVAETETKRRAMAAVAADESSGGVGGSKGSLVGWVSSRRWDAAVTPESEASRIALEASFGGPLSSLARDAGELRLDMLVGAHTQPATTSAHAARVGHGRHNVVDEMTARRELLLDTAVQHALRGSVPARCRKSAGAAAAVVVAGTSAVGGAADAADAADDEARALRREERRHRRKMSSLKKAVDSLDRTIESEQRARQANLALLKRQSSVRIASASAKVNASNFSRLENSAGRRRLEDSNAKQRESGARIECTTKLRRSLPPEQELELCRRANRLSVALDKELRADERAQMLAEHQRLRDEELAARLVHKSKRGELVCLRRAEAATIGQQLGKARSAFREARRAAERGSGEFAHAAAEAADRARLEDTRPRSSTQSLRLR